MKQAKQPDLGTQLCFAVLDADIDRTKHLLAQGADVNAVGDRRYTVVAHRIPLWLAVRSAGMIGSEHWKEFINDLGQVLPRVLDRDDAAKRARYFELIQLLIESKANLEGVSFGTTPLWPAINSADLELTQLLLTHGANPNARCLSVLSRLAKVERVKGPLGLMGYCGTLLHGAAQKSSPEIVKALLAAGADPAVTNDEGQTALQMAVERGSEQIVTILKAAQSSSTFTQK